MKDLECHIMETKIFSLSDRESNHFNQGRMIRFMLDFSDSRMKVGVEVGRHQRVK